MVNLITVVAAALIGRNNTILLAKRPAGKSMAGLWEFPGGKIEVGETPEEALSREIAEELDLSVNPCDLEPITFASHLYETFHLLMPLYVCRRWSGEIVPREGQQVAWVALKDLSEYPMPAADGPLIPVLQRYI